MSDGASMADGTHTSIRCRAGDSYVGSQPNAILCPDSHPSQGRDVRHRKVENLAQSRQQHLGRRAQGKHPPIAPVVLTDEVYFVANRLFDHSTPTDALRGAPAVRFDVAPMPILSFFSPYVRRWLLSLPVGAPSVSLLGTIPLARILCQERWTKVSLNGADAQRRA